MRGEETQVFGAMEEEEPPMICILPGTHSKWVLTKSGRIEDFMTFMSGELFAVLKDHSILGKLMQGEADDRESFEKDAFRLWIPRQACSATFQRKNNGAFSAG